jgi:hypothetical protein
LAGTTLNISRLRRLLPAFWIFLTLLLSLAGPSSASSGEFRFYESTGTRTSATPGTLPGESPTRVRIDLGGSWAYSIEGGPSGTVNVPSAFDFIGKVAYQRAFVVPANVVSGYRFQIVALGISQNAEITVNNDFITNHSGGYSSIVQSVPANSIQPFQDNVIRIVVSNQLDYRRTLPLRPLPWGERNYGGIYRDIYLLGTPQVFIRNAILQTNYDENATAAHLHVRVILDRGELKSEGSGQLGFSVEAYDKISGISVGRSPLRMFGAAESEGAVDFVVDHPKLWSPDSPDLYLLRCILSRVAGKEVTTVDEYDITAGIRDIKTTKGRILLNGKELTLQGVIWNEDHPAFGNALTYEQMEKDIAQIKMLGANLVRFIHHPPHPFMIDLCDRYGLLVLEEIPLVQVPPEFLEDEQFLGQAESMLGEILSRDQNHPAILAWGLGDGLDVSKEATRRAIERLAKQARALDTRPLYLASRCISGDVCTKMMDIAALTATAQDMRDFKAELEAWRSSHEGQPRIVVCFGTQVQQQNRTGYSNPYSQEGQARFYLQGFEVARTLGYSGGVLCSYNDWTGARPSLTVHSDDPWLYSTGLVSGDREKRLAFDAARAVFHGEKFSALPIGTYSSKAPIIFVLVGFAALVGIAYLFNASRRFRESLNRSIFSSYNFFSDVRDQHMVSLWHTILIGIGTSSGVALVLSSIMYHYRDSWFVDNLLTFILVSDTLKGSVVRVIWHPLACIGFIAGAVFVGLIVLGIVIYLVKVFFRQQIYLFHAITVAFWSASPFLTFIPIGMIVYRLMESQVYILPALIIVLVVHIWVVLRMLKGLSIVFDVYPLKMYASGIVAFLLVGVALYLYYDAFLSAPEYIRFMYHVVTHSL